MANHEKKITLTDLQQKILSNDLYNDVSDNAGIDAWIAPDFDKEKIILENEGCRVSYGDIRFTYRLNFGHRVGFTVSKKYGNAVNRNLLK